MRNMKGMHETDTNQSVRQMGAAQASMRKRHSIDGL